MQLLGAIFTRLGVLTAHPAAFIFPLVYTILWALFSPHSLEWHGLATMLTLFMTLLIQRAEHRDTQAIHAKLDELLHAQRAARNEMTRVDEMEPEEIEKARQAHRRHDPPARETEIRP